MASLMFAPTLSLPIGHLALRLLFAPTLLVCISELLFLAKDERLSWQMLDASGIGLAHSHLMQWQQMEWTGKSPESAYPLRKLLFWRRLKLFLFPAALI